MAYEELKLENQLCFPIYAASRLITRAYQPSLERLGLTYPQYLVMMVLWENDHMSVNDIAHKLILNTNTITPLLKRMEQLALLKRQRSKDDERKVLVSLTEKGQAMEEQAVQIPIELRQHLAEAHLEKEDLIELKRQLSKIISLLS